MSPLCIGKNWKQSLSLFAKKELVLFLFSWVSTFKRSFPLFLKYFWWLFALELLFRHTYFSIFPLAITSLLFIFFSTLSIRASVGNKDWFYFFTNFLKVLTFAAVYLFVFLFVNLIIGHSTNIMITAGVYTAPCSVLNTLVQTAFAGLTLLATFFLLDGLPLVITPLKAFKCAAKSVINYFPLLIPLLFIYDLFYYLFLFALSDLSPYLIVPFFLIYNFFFICAVHLVYLKIRHINYKLFFND
jgi:hypothetical protein